MIDAPTSVRIGAHNYEIRSDDETLLLLREAGSCGDSRPDRLLIRIDVDLPRTSCAETVLHEILHCIWHQTSLRVDDDAAEAEEKVVSALTPVLFNVLRSNPHIVKYLLSEEKTIVGTAN